MRLTCPLWQSAVVCCWAFFFIFFISFPSHAITDGARFVISLSDSLQEELIRILAFEASLEKNYLIIYFISARLVYYFGETASERSWFLLCFFFFFKASLHLCIHSHTSFIKSEWLSMCINSQWTDSGFGCCTFYSLTLGSKLLAPH